MHNVPKHLGHYALKVKTSFQSQMINVMTLLVSLVPLTDLTVEFSVAFHERKLRHFLKSRDLIFIASSVSFKLVLTCVVSVCNYLVQIIILFKFGDHRIMILWKL